MKFCIKDWLFLFISLLIGGAGMFQPIHPWIGHVLIIVGGLGFLFVLGFNIYRTHSKKQKEPQAQVKNETYKKFAKNTANKPSKPLSASAVNALMFDKPHECSHCGYSFSTMPKQLEKDKKYMVKNPPCPNCGNVDEVLEFY